MTDSSSPQSPRDPLNELDLSAIDPSLLEPVGSRGGSGQGSKVALLFGAITATVVVSLEPVQHWLSIRVGSVGSVVLPLALGLVSASLLWRILEAQVKANPMTRRRSFGERLQSFTKLEPWLAILGLGGALTLKVTNIAKGYEVGIGLMAIIGGISGALWLSRQIERRVDP